MFRSSIFIVLLLFAVTHLSAQQKVIPNNPNYQFQSGNEQNNQTIIRTSPSFTPYWSFGGNLGFSFWNDGTTILVAPRAYYNFSPKFIGGLGLIYNYSSYDYDYGLYDYESTYNAFGGSISSLYRPIPFLQISAEFQELYVSQDYEYINTDFSDNYWNSALYLGASFVSGNFAFGFQYDVLYDEGTSPYSSAWSPVISFYF
jgi:hypothetical protein